MTKINGPRDATRAADSGASATYQKPRQIELFVVPEVDGVVRADHPAMGRDHLAAAQASLRQRADEAMDQGPWSVTGKRTPSPTGDAHDYFSLSIYYHPNPATPDGLPYVATDGKVNPEIEDYDLPNMSRMAAAVQRLSLAYQVMGDEQAANRAAVLLRAWFLYSATRMKPDMRFAQYIPGDEGVAGPPTYPPRFVETDGGRGVFVSFGGVIEASLFPAVIESVKRLRGSEAWTDTDDAALRAWFAAFLDWLLTSPLGHDEKSTRNNHSTWYCAQVVSYALYTDQPDVARQYLMDNVPDRIQRQIDPDGSLPEELVRANPIGYVCFNLTAFYNLAMLAEPLGIDLWNLEPGKGRSLRTATRWLAERAEAEPAMASRHDPVRLSALVGMLLRTATHRYRDDVIHRAARRVESPAHAMESLLFPDQATLQQWLSD